MRRTSLFIVAAVAVLLTIALYCLLERDHDKYRVSVMGDDWPMPIKFVWNNPASWWPWLTQAKPETILSGPVVLDVPFSYSANNNSTLCLTGKLHRDADGALHFVGRISEFLEVEDSPVDAILSVGSKKSIDIKVRLPDIGVGVRFYNIQFDR